MSTLRRTREIYFIIGLCLRDSVSLVSETDGSLAVTFKSVRLKGTLLTNQTCLLLRQMQKRSHSIDDILSRLDIDALNEMQKASIEANEKHDNIVLLSATGSGKTLAFLLPIFNYWIRRIKKPGNNHCAFP